MLDSIRSFLNLSFAEISIGGLCVVVICIVAAIGLNYLTQYFLTRRPKHLAGDRLKKHDIIFGSLKKPLRALFLTVGCAFGLVVIDTPSWGVEIFHYIFIGMRALGIGFVFWYLILVTHGFTQYFAQRAETTHTKFDDMLVPLLSGIIKVVLIATGILLVLQTLGFSVMSLVTGLGIGSAAIALASKDTLSNFFGSLVVFFDHPFDIGDWISLNGVEGTVEEIRLRSTVIRTIENSIIMMPNQMLTNTYINNFERRKCRKMDCSFGVLYSTTQEQLESIIEGIKKHLADNPEIYTPTYFVAFNGFGASSLDITVVAYTNSTAKAAHMADKQKFMFEIMRIVEAAHTGFAFPTQTIDWAAGTRQSPFHIADDRREVTPQ